MLRRTTPAVVPLEEPPESLEEFPDVVLDEGVVLVRIHRGEIEPLFFSIGGRGCFDTNPEGTLYLAADGLGAFGEVLRSRLVALDEVANPPGRIESPATDSLAAIAPS
jgi:hypothetical protein